MPVGNTKRTLAACGAGQAEGSPHSCSWSRVWRSIRQAQQQGRGAQDSPGAARESQNRIRESLKLEKTPKIIKSNHHQLSPHNTMEVSHVDCNCTGCTVSVRYCKEKKMLLFCLTSTQTAFSHACSEACWKGLLMSRREIGPVPGALCLLVEGKHQASQRVRWAALPPPLSCLCSSFCVTFV